MTREEHDEKVLHLIAIGVTYFGMTIKYGPLNVKADALYAKADEFVDSLIARGYWPIPDADPEPGP
jgi:hypothetical protein